MARKKPGQYPFSLLERIANALHDGEMPLDLAVTLSEPFALERAWTEQPFVDLRRAKIYQRHHLDGPRVYVEVMMHTRPLALFATLQQLREESGMTGIGTQAEMNKAAHCQHRGDIASAADWAMYVTDAIVSHNRGDARVIAALRVHGPPELAELLDAAARAAQRWAR